MIDSQILFKSVSGIVHTNRGRDLTLARTTITAVKTAIVETPDGAINYNEIVSIKVAHVMNRVCLKISTYGYLSAVREKKRINLEIPQWMLAEIVLSSAEPRT